VTVEKAAGLSAEELHDRITIGVLTDVDKPNYTEELQKIRDIAKDKS